MLSSTLRNAFIKSPVVHCSRLRKTSLSSSSSPSFAVILRNNMSTIPSWATFDPSTAGKSSQAHAVQNLCDGQWTKATKSTMEIIHPMDRDAYPIFTIPDTQADEVQPFIDSLRKVSKSGVHNPLKNPHRYVEYGEISRKVRMNGDNWICQPSLTRHSMLSRL